MLHVTTTPYWKKKGFCVSNSKIWGIHRLVSIVCILVLNYEKNTWSKLDIASWYCCWWSEVNAIADKYLDCINVGKHCPHK